ncbi:class I SAM-dependent methyltransferase [Phreatobacter sp. AB_2022a]|uniref:class I SAM-dependent methyltransferase n=1 Tax=Phreatobacter sp. AB_2022a TaxID=3003134 RepID=UPI0022876A77|nr:class I SAM-dependent methyltransferase [Phreatobacter sp. AB_2022a]MCZ0733006.1 class I SAM-dependent methyltransferase [Phreatobacter sp. AB_2022a]
MPLSEVMNVSRYSDERWLSLHLELETYSIDKHVFKTHEGEIYRKGWEWTHCLYGLEKLGALQPNAQALGVGAGREPVIFWLADRIGHVTATDLYGNEAWAGSNGAEAPAEIVKDAKRFCAREFNSKKVTFANVDGTDIPYASNSFDFCWSLSSIEHFGGHEASARAVREMGRVVKPSGIVCIATEYLLLPEYRHAEFFTRDQIEKYVIGASPELELVDGMSWDLPPLDYLIDQICFRSDGVHRRRRHVILNDGFVQWTSFMVFLRKKT